MLRQVRRDECTCTWSCFEVYLLLLSRHVCLNIKICKYLVSNEPNMSNFHPGEVVGRGSETQLQIGENYY